MHWTPFATPLDSLQCSKGEVLNSVYERLAFASCVLPASLCGLKHAELIGALWNCVSRRRVRPEDLGVNGLGQDFLMV